MPSRRSPRWSPTSNAPTPGASGGGDPALEARVDAIEANSWVTQTRIGANEVTFAKLSDMAQGTLLGRGTTGVGDPEGVGLGVSLELPAGGSLQRAALTGDVTASANGNATTIAADAVTNAKLANMATATFKGRTTAGTGDPEDLTTAQALALLADATATTRGVVPTPPNNTTTYLRGDATFAAPPKKKAALVFGGASITAGNDRYANAAGFSTNPIGIAALYQTVPVTGSIVALVYYFAAGSMASGNITVTPRVNGVEQTTQTVTIAYNATPYARIALGTPLAVTVGSDVIAMQIDHTGSGTTGAFNFAWEIEYD